MNHQIFKATSNLITTDQIYSKQTISYNYYTAPVAWVATGHVSGWGIPGDLSLWQVYLWINRRTWTNSPNPRCFVWLALIRAKGWTAHGWCVFNGASGKPDDIPQYVALHWYRELYQCWLFSPVFVWLKWTRIILKLNKERSFLPTCYNKTHTWRLYPHIFTFGF
jgi:hypothetical protein